MHTTAEMKKVLGRDANTARWL